MDVYDTNCLNDLKNINSCYVTDISIAELIKEKNIFNKIKQTKKILKCFTNNGVELLYCSDFSYLHSKFQKSKFIFRKVYFLIKIAEQSFLRACMVYKDIIFAIALIIIFKRNKTKIKNDTLFVKNDVDVFTNKFAVCMNDINNYCVAHKKKIFLPFL